VGPGDVALTVLDPPRAPSRTRRPATVTARAPVQPPSSWWFAVLPVLFVGVFFAWPLVTVLLRGLSPEGLDVLRSASTWRVVRFTTVQALISTALTVGLGLPAAYAVHRLDFRGRRVVMSLLTVPFVLPTIVVGAAFRALLPTAAQGTMVAIVVAHVFFNLAVVVRVVGGFWTHLDDRWEQAARTLGAGPVLVWRTVTWPLLRPAVLAA